jgi:hypothetical protein
MKCKKMDFSINISETVGVHLPTKMEGRKEGKNKGRNDERKAKPNKIMKLDPNIIPKSKSTLCELKTRTFNTNYKTICSRQYHSPIFFSFITLLGSAYFKLSNFSKTL